MPHVPASPCPTPGCPELRPCPDHPATPTWAANKARRAQRGAGLTRTQETKRAKKIMRIHRGVCHVCNTMFADQVDHVIPLAEGGADDESNLRPIHRDPCHLAKSKVEAARGRARARGQQ